MKRIRRFFLHDMGRKTLALILACTVWWLVNKQITVQADVPFLVRETQSTGLPEPGTLEIHPPDGWQLASPTPGTEVRFWFKGARSRLDQFLESEPAAHFDANTSFNVAGTSGQSNFIEVKASDLRWRRPDDARALLAPVGSSQHVLNLRFDRRVEIKVDIQPEMVQVEGDPADGHRELLEHLTLSTSYIVLQGPSRKVDELVQRIQLWQQGSTPPPSILEALKIEGACGDVQHRLALHPSQSQSGMTMTPEFVEATLPVRLKSLEPVAFVRDQIQTLGSAPEGLWEPHYTARTWIAELSYHPDLVGIEFSEAWVQRHLRLFISLPELPASAQEYDLPIHWTLVDIEDRKLEELLLRTLRVRPEQDSEAKVRMTRAANQQ